jgi:hypothetical protein
MEVVIYIVDPLKGSKKKKMNALDFSESEEEDEIIVAPIDNSKHEKVAAVPPSPPARREAPQEVFEQSEEEELERLREEALKMFKAGDVKVRMIDIICDIVINICVS